MPLEAPARWRWLSVQDPISAACMTWYHTFEYPSGKYTHVRVRSEDDAKEAVLYLNNTMQVDGSYYRDNDGRWWVYAI